MVYKKDGVRYLVLPVIKQGNVILAPQPSRSVSEKDTKEQHDVSLPPTHQYAAFYLWLKRDFGADAVIHFGTHGTQEFLPGKERGLAADDWPNVLIQDMPVIYPYIMDNVGEAMIARRRGSAEIISHMTPVAVSSGSYEYLGELHQLFHNYRESEGVDTLQKGYQDRIIQVVKENNLDRDLGVNVQEITDFAQFTEELHDYITSLENEKVPYGMHTFGDMPSDELRLEMVKAMLGALYREHVIQLVREKWLADPSSKPTSGWEAEQQEERIALELLQQLLLNGLSLDELANMDIVAFDDKLREQLSLAMQYWKSFDESNEMEALLAALRGEFILPGTGGDPSRNPESMPTGRNIVAIDPATVPTPTAWEIGKKLADELLQQYYEENGKYPEKIAFALMGLETLRQQGVAESQILYLMGLQPEWQMGLGGGTVKGVVPIPQEELGRPRIDVVITASGVYRDLFPNMPALMHGAVQQAAAIDEADNYVRQHTLALEQKLQDQANLTSEEIEKLATLRMFSPDSGKYGTGLDDAADASHTWDSESELPDIYLGNYGYAYGDGIWGEQSVDLFKENLSGTELALLSRSSVQYGLLTTDHPYQNLGGIALAVRAIDGETPQLWISNLRDPNQVKMQKADALLREENRTRYWNPKWIEGQMEEGYNGAAFVSETIENLWGWDVMSPDMVSDSMWEEFKAVYVDDKYNLGTEAWFAEENPYAYQALVGRMLETIRKGYWNASEETTKQLAEKYQQFVNDFGSSGIEVLSSDVFKAELAKWIPQKPTNNTFASKKEANLVEPMLTQAEALPEQTDIEDTQNETVEEQKEIVEPEQVEQEVQKAYALEEQQKERKPLTMTNILLLSASLILMIVLVWIGYRRREVKNRHLEK